MRLNRRISSALVMIFILLLSTSLPAAAESNSYREYSTAVFTRIDFVSNIETIGVAVSGTGLPPAGELSYRQTGEPVWHSGHQLVRIDDGRLIGSLFNLSPATSYEIKVLAGSSEINGSATTQADQLSYTPSVVLNVDDNALPGGDGSVTAPFKTIQEAVNHAVPGTQVLVADGLYREAVTFPASGAPGNWIQVKAAGDAAIMDSADRLSGNIWTLYSGSHVWFKKINGPVAYLARDGERFYQYDDKTGLMQAVGHGQVSMNEGWFYEPSTLRLYVRSLDDPGSHTWQVPRLNHAFDIAARDWLWIEGFEIQYYGTTTNGCGVCTMNASHIVIRRNKIHNMQLGMFINWTGTIDQGNDTRIEQNEVYDPLVNAWPWKAVKGSYMEGTGIIIRGHIGAIVRDNNVHNFFNGIYTGSSGALENSELTFDTDIYNNSIHHVSDDGLEPEGACINQRFRNNTVDRSFIGLSVAPVTQGPTWVLRNVFTNFTGRGIKFADDSDGIVLIYQNTGWTSATNINGADLITSIHNVVMRNNIFQSTGYSFAEVPTGATANDWNHDNWYTTRGTTGPHFKWENVNYNTISALCTASGLECDGYENFPAFTNAAGGDLTLLSSSPNIDRGVVIPGINDDFVGNAPDLGAYEFAFDPPPTVLSSVRANSNPTDASSVAFTINFSESVTGVDQDDFALTTTGVLNTSISALSGSGSTYTVTINTGTGNGTVRLDVVDDDSIKDSSGQSLGGQGTNNGNFSIGESYDIQSNPNSVFNNSVWVIEKGDAPALRSEMSIYLNGISQGKTRLLRFAHEDGAGHWPEIGAIYNTGYVRLVPYHLTYGTSFILGPSYWEDWSPNDRYFHDLQITRVDIDTSNINPIDGRGPVEMTVYANDFEQTYWPNHHLNITYMITLPDPLATVTQMYVQQTFTVATPFSLSWERQLGHEGFKLVQFSSMYMDDYFHDGDALEYPSQNGNVIRANFEQIPFGKVIFSSQPWPQALSGNDPWVQLRHSDDLGWQNNTPSTRVILNTPNLAQQIIPQGYIGCSSDENNDDVGAWLNYEGAPAGFVQGYTNTVAYRLAAQDNPINQVPQQTVFPSNLNTDCNNITVTIGAATQRKYGLPVGGSTRQSFTDIDNGPAKVTSTNNLALISSMRINLKTNPTYSSYAEFMGLPASKLTDTYIFPWYNNATAGGLSSQLRFANVGNAATDVMVKIGGISYGPYPLNPNGSQRISLDNVDAGPVEVKSSGGVPIIASMRINLKSGMGFSSYSEFMGLSASSTVGTKYMFPWYNNAVNGGVSSQLRFGNVGNAATTVTVKVAGVTQPQSFSLAPNASARVELSNVDAGPVEVSSSNNVPIIASMRVNLKPSPTYSSYSEFMGLPGVTLTETRYLFPWYNNATNGGLSSQLRFGNVGSATTTVTIKIAGVAQPQTYTLVPNESARVTLTNVDSGPVEVISSNNVPIIASIRVNLKSGAGFSSYSEFIGLSVGAPLGLPGNELSTTYWFPWYNNATSGGLNSQLRFGVP